MMHEVVYINENNCIPDKYETNSDAKDIWYFDNRASNHMTGDQRYFSSLDKTITWKVRFGDDSRIDIKGKGTIYFVDMNGEPMKMTDVYFIPDLRSNIISLGQATESGCEIRLKGEHLSMHDQPSKLLFKAHRSKNILDKVSMGIIDTYELHLSKISEWNRWHARLGHVNTTTMKTMIQKGLVNRIPASILWNRYASHVCLGNTLGKRFHRLHRVE